MCLLYGYNFNLNESVRVATTGAYVFRCVASVAHLFIFLGDLMRLLVVITADTFPIDLLCFIGERYDELIIPGGEEFSYLAEYYADSLRKTKHVFYPGCVLNNDEATERLSREMVENSDGVMIVREKRTDYTDRIIKYAEKLGKKLEFVSTI